MTCHPSSHEHLASILKPNTQLKAEFAMTTEQTETQYIVVINHEEQYSIWPDFKEIPLGWKDANFRGAKAACLEHINTVWTDMRPLSLRLKMNATTA
jgi:MbtH protein